MTSGGFDPTNKTCIEVQNIVYTCDGNFIGDDANHKYYCKVVNNVFEEVQCPKSGPASGPECSGSPDPLVVTIDETGSTHTIYDYSCSYTGEYNQTTDGCGVTFTQNVPYFTGGQLLTSDDSFSYYYAPGTSKSYIKCPLYGTVITEDPINITINYEYTDNTGAPATYTAPNVNVGTTLTIANGFNSGSSTCEERQENQYKPSGEFLILGPEGSNVNFISDGNGSWTTSLQS